MVTVTFILISISYFNDSRWWGNLHLLRGGLIYVVFINEVIHLQPLIPEEIFFRAWAIEIYSSRMQITTLAEYIKHLFIEVSVETYT